MSESQVNLKDYNSAMREVPRLLSSIYEHSEREMEAKRPILTIMLPRPFPRQAASQNQRSKEFIRYVISGCCATAVNLAVVLLARQFISYEIAVFIGAIFGTSTTYLMTKIFVFGAKNNTVDYSEIVRFICIHGVVCLQIWFVSVSLERWILPVFELGPYREAMASFIGVGSVVFTGYFLHRNVTYDMRQ